VRTRTARTRQARARVLEGLHLRKRDTPGALSARAEKVHTRGKLTMYPFPSAVKTSTFCLEARFGLPAIACRSRRDIPWGHSERQGAGSGEGQSGWEADVRRDELITRELSTRTDRASTGLHQGSDTDAFPNSHITPPVTPPFPDNPANSAQKVMADDALYPAPNNLLRSIAISSISQSSVFYFPSH